MPDHSQVHPPAELKALTSLRYLAALWVVAYHLWPTNATLPGPLETLRARGWMGVPFFFLLSGFILAYVYHDRPLDRDGRRRFWWARIARIYPLYLLSLLIYAPILVLLHGPIFSLPPTCSTKWPRSCSSKRGCLGSP